MGPRYPSFTILSFGLTFEGIQRLAPSQDGQRFRVEELLFLVVSLAATAGHGAADGAATAAGVRGVHTARKRSVGAHAADARFRTVGGTARRKEILI